MARVGTRKKKLALKLDVFVGVAQGKTNRTSSRTVRTFPVLSPWLTTPRVQLETLRSKLPRGTRTSTSNRVHMLLA